jgi:CxxC-x17-CxxC domain-containing protein
LADRTLTCRDCGSTFIFTEGEQAFYTSRGFSDPVRCPACRAAKKSNRGSGDSDYGDSYGNGGGRSGGYSSSGYGDGGYGGGSSNYGDSYGNGGGGYGRERAPRQMTTVICSNCGQETQVPFVPTGNRPVYCSDCFAQMGGGSRGRN